MTLKKTYRIRHSRAYTIGAVIGICGLGVAWPYQSFPVVWVSVLALAAWLIISSYGTRLIQVEVHNQLLKVKRQTKSPQRLVIHQIIFCPWLIILQGKELYRGRPICLGLSLICLKEKDFVEITQFLRATQKRV